MTWSKPGSFLDSFKKLFPPKESVISFIKEELNTYGFKDAVVFYKNNQVTIKIKSSVVRQEAMFILNDLHKKIKERFPNQLVTKIIITS
jgi:hypothetical protein